MKPTETLRYRLAMSFILSVVFLSSCVTSNLEYDRMSGTNFPAQGTDSAGNTEDISTMFGTGGQVLTVDFDQNNIPALTGQSTPLDPFEFNFITTAELQTLELANRSVQVDADTTITAQGNQNRKYFVWGIVVNHFREDAAGNRTTGTMGLMYDPNLRSAFTNYFRNTTLNSNNNLYLRSAAHEVGHAFNLSHGDGDGNTTIMNQTSAINTNSFQYRFSSSSLDHLQNHVKEAVFPGIGPRDFSVPHIH